jgi:DNA polymerase IV (archaeal DinB-like DNA polymerase)
LKPIGIDTSSSSTILNMTRRIMHIDFDYFFAQCEEIRRPELRDRPIVICVFSGRTEDSGVVSTANYMARKFGVKSGIPIRVAKSRLAAVSGAVFMPLDAAYYSRVSEDAMSVIRSYGGAFECLGIDECYIDVSDRTDDFQAARILAQHIKEDLKRQIQLRCSIGVASNKILTKMASDMNKPDGLTVIEPSNAIKFIANMEVVKIPGVGAKTRETLRELGVKTIGDLAKFDLFRLIDCFGKKRAIYMHNAANGIDNDPVIEFGGRQRIMRIATLKRSAVSSAEMNHDLYVLCRSVFKRASERKLSFKTVGVILILDNLDSVTKSRSLKMHSTNFESLHSTAKSTLDEVMKEAGSIKVRRLGLVLSDLQSSVGQNTMFDFMSSSG